MKSLFALTFLTVSLALTAENPPAKEKDVESAMSRLPVGATLTEVSLPRFDTQKRRASLLTAETMVVESEERFKAENLVLRLFDKDTQAVSGIATMDQATYLVAKEHLAANGELLIKSTEDRFAARGQGGVLTLNSRQGLLLGHAETMFLKRPKKRTAMIPSSLLPFITGIQLLAAVPPPAVTAEELVEFERLVAPSIVPNFNPEVHLETAALAEKGLTTRLAAFLTAVGHAQLLGQTAAPTTKPQIPFEDLFKPGKKRIIIKSLKGIYFDGENHELAYLGSSTLKGKGITMTCDGGMKVLFDPPEKKEKDPKNKEGNDLLGGFQGPGEMKQFTARDNIVLTGKTKKGEPIRISGDRAVYDAKADKITIRGKQLKFRVGGFALRSQNQDAYVVITLLGDENISAQTEGVWETALPDKLKKKK